MGTSAVDHPVTYGNDGFPVHIILDRVFGVERSWVERLVCLACADQEREPGLYPLAGIYSGRDMWSRDSFRWCLCSVSRSRQHRSDRG